MVKEIQINHGQFNHLNKDEMDEVIRHTLIFGYSPSLKSQRHNYGKLKKLKRLKLQHNSRKINNKIDEVNAQLRICRKEEQEILSKHMEHVAMLKMKKVLALKRQ